VTYFSNISKLCSNFSVVVFGVGVIFFSTFITKAIFITIVGGPGGLRNILREAAGRIVI